MERQNIRKIKGDGRAPSVSNSFDASSSPAAREFPQIRRSARIAGLQARHADNSATDKEKKRPKSEFKSPKVTSSSKVQQELLHTNIYSSKSVSGTNQPLQPHSTTSFLNVNCGSEDAKSNDFDCPDRDTFQQHMSRNSNKRADFDYEMKQKIQFPTANDRRWKEWDAELAEKLPKEFTSRLIGKLSSTKISKKNDEYLYIFFC